MAVEAIASASATPPPGMVPETSFCTASRLPPMPQSDSSFSTLTPTSRQCSLSELKMVDSDAAAGGPATAASEPSSSLEMQSTSERRSWPPCEVAAFLRVHKGEDRFAHCRAEIGGENIQLALIVDGHGGAISAEHCKEKLLDMVVDLCAGDASAESLTAATSAAFNRIHLLLRSIGRALSDGCAGTLVAINEDRHFVMCANVGDCSAVIIPGKRASKEAPWFEVITTNDRLGENQAEVERALAAGCKIGQALNSAKKPYGPIRAWPGGLMYARALGDADCGNWLIPEPHISVSTFEPESYFCILICSDGVWDALETAVVAKIVRSACTVRQVAESVVNKATNAHHPYHTAEWNQPRDDTTALAIAVGRESPPASVEDSERKSSSRRGWRVLSMNRSSRSATSEVWPSNRSAALAEASGQPSERSLKQG